MDFSSKYFPNGSAVDLWDSRPMSSARSAPIAALSFVTTIAMTELEEFSFVGLGLSKRVLAGRGAASTVQIGKTEKGKLVTVKLNHIESRSFTEFKDAAFELHLSRMALEIRILAHREIRANVNIVDVVGYAVYESAGLPASFLVLEYAEYGDMRHFLRSHRDYSTRDCVKLCHGVANGLQALHRLKVCHGDVKLDNVLVFPDEVGKGWVAKIADLSHALVANGDDTETKVAPGFGTPLLNAPEIRTGTACNNEAFTIDDALVTDTFSLGLLFWEALKKGDSFFDNCWHCAQMSDIHSLENKEFFLNSLTQNGLLHLGLDFLDDFSRLDIAMYSNIKKVFQGALQDEPGRRMSIRELQKILKNATQDE